MAGRPVIRDFRPEDAPAALDLLCAVGEEEDALSARGLLHRFSSYPPRAHARFWAAEEDGRIVGFARAHFKWAAEAEGVARLWVGVRPEARRSGLGGELWVRAEAHLIAHGARELVARVAGDPAGRAFVEARRLRPGRRTLLSVLDPREADLRDLPRLETAKRAEGFRLASLGELLDRPDALHALYLSADADSPADHPHTPMSLDEWRRETLEHPDLDPDGSVVALAGIRPVAFAWLLVDRESGRAENEMTGTAPDLRGRRLATLAKLAATRWAARNGIFRLFAGNDEGNPAMLAINRRLGYRRIGFVTDWTRETQ